MRFKKSCIILILLWLGVHTAHSQESHTEICIDFRVNSTQIEANYQDNARRMQYIIEFLQNLRQDSTLRVVEISFAGAASPEGSAQQNRRLAQGRLSSLEKFVRREVHIPDSLVTRNDHYIPWGHLETLVEESDLPHKAEVLAILREQPQLVDYPHPDTHVDNRIVKLKQLDGGKVWQQLNRQFFAQMRNACAVFVTYKRELPPTPDPPVVPDTPAVVLDPVVEVIEQTPDTISETPDTPAVAPVVVPEIETWTRRILVKTNGIGWAMGIANLAAEIDLARHWSFTLPIYYSAWNYFTSKVKFRTFALQPEFRYWLSEHNDGFFAGAHFGMAYYNFALPNGNRYQDHDRRSPALGGGLSVGYRLPLDKKNRWRVEFALGAGAYSLHYDKFSNPSSTSDGRLMESVKKTFWGIDQVAVSFSYSFDLKKKGGKR